VKTLNKIRSVLSKITGVANIITYIGISVMILITVLNVILRYVFNAPISGSMEIGEYSLLVAVFASFSHGQMVKSHVAVTALLVKFPRRLKYIVFTILNLLGTVVVTAASIAAGQQASIAGARGYITSILEMKTAPFLWAECVLLALFALVVLYDTVCSCFAIFDDDMAQEISKDWL